MKYALHFGPEALHIDLEGAFTFTDSHAFHGILKALRDNTERSSIHVNLSKLMSIDSTAGHLLMLLHDYAKLAHCSLVFVEPTSQVMQKLKEYSQHNAIHIAA